jgi:hypothetical protein
MDQTRIGIETKLHVVHESKKAGGERDVQISIPRLKDLHERFATKHRQESLAGFRETVLISQRVYMA